jgi:hypothetical protein
MMLVEEFNAGLVGRRIEEDIYHLAFMRQENVKVVVRINWL